MPYNTTNYTPSQQAAVAQLLAKSYGIPAMTAITAYAPGDLVTADLFNQRVVEIEGLLSYLEDSRRDETTRGQLAEQALDLKYQQVVMALTSPSWVVTPYTGTLNPGGSLVIQAGEAFVAGNLITYPGVNYGVSFTPGTPQVLVAHADGTLTAVDSPFAAGSSDLVVGTWTGSTYAAATATRTVGGTQPTVYQSDLSTQANFAVGGDSTLTGALTVSGAAQMGTTLNVAGTSTLTGPAALGNTLGVTGATTLSSTLTVAGTTRLNNTLTVTGNTALGANLVVAGNLTVQGTTTTVQSTVVDFADRVIHVNDSTSPGTPTLTTGLAVHRGLNNGVERPHGALIWSENGGTGLWTATFSPADDSDLLTGQEVDLRARAATLTDNLAVQGATTLGGPLTVGSVPNASQLIITNVGTSPLADTITFGDGTGWKLQINSRALTPLTLLEITDTGTVNIPGTLTAGQFTVTSQTTAGDQTVGGNLTVTGSTTLNGAVTVNAPVTLSSTNRLIVGGTFTAGSLSTFNNTLTVTAGGMAVTGGVALSGNTVITDANTLTVGTGATTLGGNLTVTGETTMQGNLMVQGNLTVGGSITEIDSTVMTIADRLVHLNVTTGTAPAPVLPAGVAVNRGNNGSNDRVAGALLWFENGGIGKWLATFSPADDNSAFVAGQEVDFQARTVTATQDLNVSGNVTLGSGNQNVTYEVGTSIDTDTRATQTQFNASGTLDSVSEMDGAIPVKVTSFSYDSAGNISNVTTVAGGKTVVKTYTYDANGILLGMTKSVT